MSAGGQRRRVEERWMRPAGAERRAATGLARGHAYPAEPSWASEPRTGRIRDLQVPETGATSPDSYTAGVAGTIMIVEDEPAVARGVQVALEREGYT